MKVVVLTGAGISAESGIETFRAADGLWCNHRVEDVASPEGFIKNPSLVHQFYNQRRRQLLSEAIKPNAAHFALARLEEKITAQGGSFLLISQNIDNLHTRAGSQNLIQMHGELLKVSCNSCAAVIDWLGDCDQASICPSCNQKTLRPHIVWFGEMPFQLDDCFDALSDCTLFAAIGTSGLVYPAAGFAEVARSSGAKCVEINLEKTSSNRFDQHYIGKASEQVQKWLDHLISD